MKTLKVIGPSLYMLIYVYIYIYSPRAQLTSIFEGQGSTKQRLFQSKKGSFGFNRYIYTYPRSRCNLGRVQQLFDNVWNHDTHGGKFSISTDTTFQPTVWPMHGSTFPFKSFTYEFCTFPQTSKMKHSFPIGSTSCQTVQKFSYERINCSTNYTKNYFPRS